MSAPEGLSREDLEAIERLAAAGGLADTRLSDIVTFAQQMFLLQVGNHRYMDSEDPEKTRQLFKRMALEVLDAAEIFITLSREEKR